MLWAGILSLAQGKSVPQGQAYVPPLARSQDAIIFAVPRNTPASLSHLHNALRRFDGVDEWDHAGVTELNQEERSALDKALEVFRAALPKPSAKSQLIAIS